MRLTTRLMQMASWLLLQRAVNNGEMNRDQVLAEKNKVRLDSFNCDRSAQGWNDLPEAFRDLVEALPGKHMDPFEEAGVFPGTKRDKEPSA